LLNLCGRDIFENSTNDLQTIRNSNAKPNIVDLVAHALTLIFYPGSFACKVLTYPLQPLTFNVNAIKTGQDSTHEAGWEKIIKIIKNCLKLRPAI
jgi:hypothetical protein